MMKNNSIQYENVDDYIAKSAVEVRDILKQIRSIIFNVANDAAEEIAYGMPAYKINGKPLIYFASFQNHIGLYATPEAHKKFSKQLSKYKQGKGSVRFPLDQPIPYDLIKSIVKYKLETLIK